ncbi:unnamed protein product [Bursaphelenchus xylophilus]|uniref:(pine wood nematode) hypothetical protein n=1 Tax=Bursaphelenchus xylophilus TaxID=6326 RepID=A0A1I7S394_BURXY|nr:unnamed protein product [Bursaphelenchus xylophilus]CAG9116151.1 unnamed protein product [Bursaphelenchus xylophilus]
MKSNGTSRIDLNEGISNGFAPGRSPQGGPSYYYSSQPTLVHASNRSLNQPPPPVIQPVHHTASAASSPAQPVSHTYRTVTTTKVDPPHRSGTLPANPITRRTPSLPAQGMEPPSYYVEHLASFAVGREHGLVSTTDGIKKLKEMEQKSAVFAQPMILKLYPDRISVEEENGEVVEQFNMELVTEPTAHQSNDPHDVFNNVILFTVKEDTRNGRRSFVPTEMHIFQCVRVSAQDLASDIYQYMRKNYHKVRGGRRGGEYGHTIPPPAPSSYYDGHTSRRDYRDEAGGGGSDYFEVDVNTLNKCFDDIERFVARIQSAAIAQRELELYNHRFRSNQRKHRAHDAALAAQHGILQMRAQLPTYQEFYDVFQKFKLSFNLLAKLKNHIREPNAPELLHFLFTPLTVILDACHWGLNRNVAQEVISPLLTYDACDLLRNCLISKEQEVWAALGKAWRTPPEDWTGPPVPPFRPIFNTPNFFGTFEPPSRYTGAPNAIHRGASAPPPQQHFAPPYRGPPHRERSVDNIDLEKVNLEKERLEFERMKVREREARLQEEERRLKQEQARLEAERRLLHKEAEKQSMAGSDRPDFYRRDEYSSHSPRADRRTASVQQLNGHTSPASPRPNIPIPIPDQSPRQKAYLDGLIQRRAKVVQVTYDRVAQNAKELTVDRGEYLQVLNDTKNWWECKNASDKVGYVPHTILALVTVDETEDRIQGLPQHNPSALQPGSAISPRPGYQMSEPSSIRSYDHSLLDRLHSVKLRPILDELTPSEPGSFDGRPSQRLPKLIMEEQKYVPEMVATIKSNAPIIGLRRASSIRGPQLTPNSAISEVQSWLTAKDFSDYTKKVLSKCQGLHLFQLTKELLFKYCGEEGNRLFSLILAQKKRCNYKSTRGDQLKALLEMRKEHVDENNEAEMEPNLDPPEILDENGNNINKQNNTLTPREAHKSYPHRIVPINPYKDIPPENRAVEFLRDNSHTVRAYH